MLYRLVYACVQAWKHRKILARYVVDSDLQIASIIDLSPMQLWQSGVKGLILDFDGVLAANSKKQPVLEVERWLHACCEVFPRDRIFILSNKPTLVRKQYFAENFQGINFIIAKYNKPFPYSILTILQDTKLLPEEILVIDDRLCTGILAAIISNVRAYLVTTPYKDYKASPILERLYCIARNLEYWLFKD